VHAGRDAVEQEPLVAHGDQLDVGAEGGVGALERRGRGSTA
jgi:hypothetical protein